MNKIFILMLLSSLLFSCNNNQIYSKYKSIDHNKWHKDSIVSFNVDIKDTLSNHAIYLNLRNDKDYNFNNIFLIVNVNYPNKNKITDTLEYRMTDEKGRFLGSGFTDIKENKLAFKENIIFPLSGKYQFNIQQAVRKNGKENGIEFLEGITDVGLEIEKIK